VQQWSEEHPEKTMLQDLLEKYPNTPMKLDDNAPMICPHHLGYPEREGDCENDCLDCWNRPLEVEL